MYPRYPTYYQERRQKRREKLIENTLITIFIAAAFLFAALYGQILMEYRQLEAKYEAQEMNCSAMFQAL